MHLTPPPCGTANARADGRRRTRCRSAARSTRRRRRVRRLRSGKRRVGAPLLATNDSHYAHADEAEAHDALLCIQTGKGINDPNRMKFPNHEFYLKSQDEMERVFREVPEALASTIEIATNAVATVPATRRAHQTGSSPGNRVAAPVSPCPPGG